MTREETSKVLTIMKATYPNFYKDMARQDMVEMLDVWSDIFASEDVNIVKIALREVLQTSKYPPTIADIKEKMYTLTNPETLPTDLWDKLKKAISNSGYNSVEEFEKLPEECKLFVKSPRQLKELSQNDEETNNTVVKGQFFKQIENIQKRIKEEKQMLPETRKLREMVANIGKGVSRILDE